ncbi:hypothetical protein CDAR_569101 [Caerostris darwini]|uniref:Uncharacterized protein n=1 Tax=Caerostris darwini TaxID=1538125 RepID=A0AAV4QE02_9ARAC|nr:hypothetical protein CDAR_569101 [Caerostris darwini]
MRRATQTDWPRRTSAEAALRRRTASVPLPGEGCSGRRRRCCHAAYLDLEDNECKNNDIEITSSFLRTEIPELCLNPLRLSAVRYPAERSCWSSPSLLGRRRSNFQGRTETQKKGGEGARMQRRGVVRQHVTDAAVTRSPDVSEQAPLDVRMVVTPLLSRAPP